MPPRVVRDAVELRHADVEAAELARGREPDRHDAARREQPLDHRRRRGRDAIAEHERRFGRRPADDRLELLHADRHAAERRGRRRRSAPQSIARSDVEERERVEIARRDRGERRFQLLDRRAPLRAERVDERARVTEPRRIGHEMIMSLSRRKMLDERAQVVPRLLVVEAARVRRPEPLARTPRCRSNPTARRRARPCAVSAVMPVAAR